MFYSFGVVSIDIEAIKTLHAINIVTEHYSFKERD